MGVRKLMNHFVVKVVLFLVVAALRVAECGDGAARNLAGSRSEVKALPAAGIGNII
jgi:hypothetical protein